MLAKLISRTLRHSFCNSKAIEASKKYSESISKARVLMKLYQLQPKATGQVFIAPNATIVGDVFLGEMINIGHGTVIRGDINTVELNRNVYIGDNCVLHTASSLPTGLPATLSVQADVTIQSGCTLSSCTIQDNAFIGYNSVILEGAIVEEGAIVLPNSVVPPGRVVPANQVWSGNPIKFVRFVHDQEKFVTKKYAERLFEQTHVYKFEFIPYNNAYLYKPTNPQDQTIKNYHFVTEEDQLHYGLYQPNNPTN